MSSVSFRRSSISKQRGAEMSSRLMPPKPGAIRIDRLDDLVRVLRVEADREGVDAGELLEEHRLALHHRHCGLGSDVAEAEHGGAVADDGDRVALDRVLEGLARGPRRSRCRRARRPACRPSRGRRGSSAGACCAARSCRRRASGTCGRSRRRRCAPSTPLIAARISSQWSASLASTVTSRTSRSPTSTRSTAPMVPPASPMAPATRPSMPGRSSISTRMVRLYCADGVAHDRAVYVGRRRRAPAVASGARARRAVPDRRQQPRLPCVLRAAGVRSPRPRASRRTPSSGSRRCS